MWLFEYIWSWKRLGPTKHILRMKKKTNFNKMWKKHTSLISFQLPCWTLSGNESSTNLGKRIQCIRGKKKGTIMAVKQMWPLNSSDSGAFQNFLSFSRHGWRWQTPSFCHRLRRRGKEGKKSHGKVGLRVMSSAKVKCSFRYITTAMRTRIYNGAWPNLLAHPIWIIWVHLSGWTCHRASEAKFFSTFPWC